MNVRTLDVCVTLKARLKWSGVNYNTCVVTLNCALALEINMFVVFILMLQHTYNTQRCRKIIVANAGIDLNVLGPVSLNIFARNSNSMENSPCYNSAAGNQIATNICPCHDSTAVVLFPKFCSDHCIRMEVRVKKISIEFELRWKSCLWNGAQIERLRQYCPLPVT